MSELSSSGREIFDQTPVEYPIEFERPIPLHIRIQQQILSVMRDMRNQDEVDTPEDADDFDMDDDPEMWSSPYEGDFDHLSKMKGAVSKEDAPASSDGTTQETSQDKSEAGAE